MLVHRINLYAANKLGVDLYCRSMWSMALMLLDTAAAAAECMQCIPFAGVKSCRRSIGCIAAGALRPADI